MAAVAVRIDPWTRGSVVEDHLAGRAAVGSQAESHGDGAERPERRQRRRDRSRSGRGERLNSDAVLGHRAGEGFGDRIRCRDRRRRGVAAAPCDQGRCGQHQGRETRPGSQSLHEHSSLPDPWTSKPGTLWQMSGRSLRRAGCHCGRRMMRPSDVIDR